jgi:SPP1 gp7 family putative phage head morphogenesis protein
VSRSNQQQLSRQIRAALGADVLVGDVGLRPIVQGFAAENAALIRDIPDKIIGEVERATTRAISGGKLHRDLAKEIEQRFAFGRDRARLIARDQVGKLYGQINTTRQKNVGVTHFFWRTSNDERVRDEHTAIDGQRFAYADGGAPGEGLPGEAVNCRCYADPDFSGILDRV